MKGPKPESSRLMFAALSSLRSCDYSSKVLRLSCEAWVGEQCGCKTLRKTANVLRNFEDAYPDELGSSGLAEPLA